MTDLRYIVETTAMLAVIIGLLWAWSWYLNRQLPKLIKWFRDAWDKAGHDPDNTNDPA